MVGGAFKSHPKQQNATINILNHDFKAMQHFGKTWLHFDEWYNFRNPINPNAVVLATVDESTYKGGTMGANHPVVWYQNYEGGKIFTTALGHTKESYTNPDFVKMIQEAVVWTGGK
jgi:type 1 glutamine amidotransferase